VKNQFSTSLQKNESEVSAGIVLLEEMEEEEKRETHI